MKTQQIKDLIERYRRLNERHEFNPGDIVEWKPELCNRKLKDPQIVIEVLDEPLLDAEKNNSGSSYFREPLDIIVGAIDEDVDFLILFHLDSRRLQPYGFGQVKN